jgi:hypothetical protein
MKKFRKGKGHPRNGTTPLKQQFFLIFFFFFLEIFGLKSRVLLILASKIWAPPPSKTSTDICSYSCAASSELFIVHEEMTIISICKYMCILLAKHWNCTSKAKNTKPSMEDLNYKNSYVFDVNECWRSHKATPIYLFPVIMATNSEM